MKQWLYKLKNEKLYSITNFKCEDCIEVYERLEGDFPITEYMFIPVEEYEWQWNYCYFGGVWQITSKFFTCREELYEFLGDNKIKSYPVEGSKRVRV